MVLHWPVHTGSFGNHGGELGHLLIFSSGHTPVNCPLRLDGGVLHVGWEL